MLKRIIAALGLALTLSTPAFAITEKQANKTMYLEDIVNVCKIMAHYFGMVPITANYMEWAIAEEVKSFPDNVEFQQYQRARLIDLFLQTKQYQKAYNVATQATLVDTRVNGQMRLINEELMLEAIKEAVDNPESQPWTSEEAHAKFEAADESTNMTKMVFQVMYNLPVKRQ